MKRGKRKEATFTTCTLADTCISSWKIELPIGKCVYECPSLQLQT